jgi:hypothetical protein
LGSSAKKKNTFCCCPHNWQLLTRNSVQSLHFVSTVQQAHHRPEVVKKGKAIPVSGREGP